MLNGDTATTFHVRISYFIFIVYSLLEDDHNFPCEIKYFNVN